MSDTPLPSCIEIEKSVISEFVANHKTWTKYSYLINPEYFYVSFHRQIIEYMISTNVTDMMVLQEKFKNKDNEIVSICTEYFAAMSNLEPQIEILKDRYERRKVITAAVEAQTKAMDFDIPSDQIVEQAIDGMSSTITYDSRPEHIGVITSRVFDELGNNPGGAGLKSGLTDFDQVIGGLCPGEMVILAARPSMGKTTFALQIARHNAIQVKIPILIFSIETSKVVMAGRIISSEGNANYDHALRGYTKEITKMSMSAGAVAESAIYIDDTAAISMAQIESKTDCYVKNFGVKLVIIDHVGLIKNISRGRSRHEELSETSKAIKALGKRYNIPTLTICQLSREVEKRKPPIPIMSDLRESGSFEEDADKIVFLYREEYYNRNSDKKGICDVIVAKNKNGRTGHREVKTEFETMNFRNLSKDEWPEQQPAPKPAEEKPHSWHEDY